jgi:hypothetical protein
MADQHAHNSIPDFNEWMSEALQNHLAEKLSAVQEVGEIQHAIHELAGKENRRIRLIKQHMMTCGECLSAQIKSGTLIDVGTYWKMREEAGGGRYPKLHYMVN